jgi:transketolase
LLQENQQLKHEFNQSKERLLTQAETYQQQFEKLRESQEQSENRWLNLIDQAKQETKEIKKQFEQYRKTSEQAITQFKDKLANIQQSQSEQVTRNNLQLEQINQLKHEKTELITENTNLQKNIAGLKQKPSRNIKNGKKKGNVELKYRVNLVYKCQKLGYIYKKERIILEHD